MRMRLPAMTMRAMAHASLTVDSDSWVGCRSSWAAVGKLPHKKIIYKKLFTEGKSVEQTARETHHSPAAVIRYANDFKQVRECVKEGWDAKKTVFATGLSTSLTEQYLDMLNGGELPF